MRYSHTACSGIGCEQSQRKPSTARDQTQPPPSNTRELCVSLQNTPLDGVLRGVPMHAYDVASLTTLRTASP